jgi:hypothetical protein
MTPNSIPVALAALYVAELRLAFRAIQEVPAGRKTPMSSPRKSGKVLDNMEVSYGFIVEMRICECFSWDFGILLGFCYVNSMGIDGDIVEMFVRISLGFC